MLALGVSLGSRLFPGMDHIVTFGLVLSRCPFCLIPPQPVIILDSFSFLVGKADVTS